MKSHIDLAILANWVSMLRADVDGAIWLSDDLVEGRFYERLGNKKSRVVPSPGLARELLSDVEARGTAGVVATVREGAVETLPENVFRPGLGDVASILVASDACERVLKEIVGANWLKACEKEIGSLRHRTILLTWVIMKIAIQSGRSLAEAAPSVASLIDWERFELSQTALSLTYGTEVIAEIHSLSVSAEKARTEMLLRDVNGEDVIELMTAATRLYHPRGLHAERAVGAMELAALLRVAFDLPEIERDEMYWRMRRWEWRNPRFPLLDVWRVLDPLQVVWDQRYWENDLKAMLSGTVGEDGVSVFKMDLDNFKHVNDSLGHAFGDEALRLYCGVVQRLLGSVGEVYRRGGDEVVALVPGLDGDRAVELAEALRGLIEEEFQLWSGVQNLAQSPTASIGVVAAKAGAPFESVVRVVDEAQRQAKQQGKNRVVFLPVSE